MQNFSGLKGAFPGRIKRSSNRRDSESSGQDGAKEPSTHAEPADLSASRNSSVQASGAQSAELAAEAAPQVRLGDQSYQESRLRKFNAIISKNFVDLTALEEVRPSSSSCTLNYCTPVDLAVAVLGVQC